MVMNFEAPKELLQSYEDERKSVAQSVIDTSGELVRSTKYSRTGTHAQDYVNIVQRRSGNITGMGIRYGNQGLCGSRVFDFEVFKGNDRTRLYSILDYTKFSLLILGECEINQELPEFINVIQVKSKKCEKSYWTNSSQYINKSVLIRPDAYIESFFPLNEVETLIKQLKRG